MKEKIKNHAIAYKNCNRILKIMKISFLMMFLCFFTITAENIYAQQAEVSLNLKNVTLKKAISEIEKASDYVFLISDEAKSELSTQTTLKANQESIQHILEILLSNTNLDYIITERQVSIYKNVKENAKQPTETKVTQPVQQKKKVSGQVIDEEGEPVIGANIMEKGTTNGVVTDYDGNFALNVENNAVLQISYIGYISQEINTAGKATLNVTLAEDTQSLEEVVVIAYGEQKRSSFTGSAAVISSEAISKRPVTNAMAALEGISPGVQVQTSSGGPNSSPSFRIRGVGSINASTSPLIVVDGVPYEGGWNNINPNDVESITVLKDAASTAIYGARGGNGVILLTTKSGTRDKKLSVVLDSKLSLTQVRKSDLYDVINSPGAFYEQQYQALYNYYQDVFGMSSYNANQAANDSWTLNADQGGLGYLVYTIPDGENLIGHNGKLNPNAALGRIVTGTDGKAYFLTPDDWFKNSFTTGIKQDYNLRISGGSENTSLLTSLGYTNDQGITSAAFLERFTGRIKGVMNARKWLRLSTNLDISVSEYQNDYDSSDNSNNIFSNVNRVAPIYPIFIRDENGNIIQDENGDVYDYGDGTHNYGISRPINTGSNRIQEALIQTQKYHNMKMGAKVAADFIITPELTATFNVAYDQRDRRYISTRQPFYGSSNPGGTVSVSAPKTITLNNQQLINYNKGFNNGHNVKVTLLHEMYDSNSYSLSGGRSNMFNYFENQELAGAITMTSNNSYTSNYQSEGYGGRILYDYKNIYNFDASYRRDASTNFHPNYRWGNFYSFGGAYLISREEFFKVAWVDELKLKLSFGQNGNDGIGSHRYVDTYSIENLDGEIAVTFLNPGNPHITWETRTAINTGVEFELLNRRLRGGVDYYHNITSNMLSSVSVPYSLGYSSYYDNVGSMRNRGIELDLQGDIIRNKDFKWTMFFNAAINKSKILELADERKGQTLYNLNGEELAVGYSSSDYFYGEGMEYQTWYIKKFAGINEIGKPLWYLNQKDDDGNVMTTDVYSSADYFASGSTQPKLIGGFGGVLSYKNIDLSFTFSYRLGGLAYDSGYATLMTGPYNGHTGYNFHKDVKYSWTPENPNNEFARFQYDDRYFTSSSDRWLTKADYLNFQNISLGYHVPKKLVKELGIEGLTASVAVDNVVYLSHRKGFVPSTTFGGSTAFGRVPAAGNYMLNLNIKF